MNIIHVPLVLCQSLLLDETHFDWAPGSCIPKPFSLPKSVTGDASDRHDSFDRDLLRSSEPHHQVHVKLFDQRVLAPTSANGDATSKKNVQTSKHPFQSSTLEGAQAEGRLHGRQMVSCGVHLQHKSSTTRGNRGAFIVQVNQTVPVRTRDLSKTPWRWPNRHRPKQVQNPKSNLIESEEANTGLKCFWPAGC